MSKVLVNYCRLTVNEDYQYDLNSYNKIFDSIEDFGEFYAKNNLPHGANVFIIKEMEELPLNQINNIIRESAISLDKEYALQLDVAENEGMIWCIPND